LADVKLGRADLDGRYRYGRRLFRPLGVPSAGRSPEIDPLGFLSLGEPSSFNGLFIVSLSFAWLVISAVGLGVIWFMAYRYDRITTRRAINEITGTPRRSGKKDNQLS
jgi:hypothetical protein